MAHYNEDIVKVELTTGTIFRSFLSHAIGSGDNLANRYGVEVLRNGETVELSGASCQGFFIAPDGQHILISGSSYAHVSGNRAYVDLPQACYNVEGQFTLAIKVIGGGITGTLRIVDGVVCNTGYDGAVAPTGSVPTYQEILALYDEMLAATADAEAVGNSVIGSNLTESIFEKGSMEQGQDDSYLGQSRIRTQIVKLTEDISITPLNGAAFFVDYMKQDGTFDYSSEWKTETYIIRKGSSCRVCLAYTRNDSTERTINAIYSRFIIGMCAVEDVSEYEDIEPLFEYGSLENGLDNSYRAGVRIRTRGVCTSKMNIVIRFGGGNARFAVSWFDNEGGYTGSSGWLSKDFMIPAGTFWRLVVDGNINAENDETYPMNYIQSRIEMDKKTPYQYSSNPNIIWQCRDVDDTNYPPHSKAAIKLAAENQYDRVKCCCRVTTDGYFVAVHNNTINGLARNPDGTQISSTINTDDCSLAQLNQYDWGIQYGAQFAGMDVPMVADVMKYAAMYGLGLTLEFYFYPTDAQKDDLLALLEQYGLVENLIIVTSNYHHFASMNYWKGKNKKISYYIGGTYAEVSGMTTDINNLKTGENTIYVEPLPWQTVPDAAFRHMAVTNDWRLYSSGAMSESDLFNTVGVNHGFTLISVGGVYTIKDAVRRWANKQS